MGLLIERIYWIDKVGGRVRGPKDSGYEKGLGVLVLSPLVNSVEWFGY